MSVLVTDVIKVGVVREVTRGLTPASPAFQLLRVTGESLAFTPVSVNSAEMKPGRGIADSVLTGSNTAGDINFELAQSPGFELMLAAALASEWGDTLGYDPGDIPGSFDETDGLLLGSTIQSFSYMKEWELESVFGMHVFPEIYVNTMSLTITPNQIITGNFGLLGAIMNPRTTALSGQSEIAAGSNPIFTAPNVVVGRFLETDLTTPLNIAIGTHCFNNITINLNNNLRSVECIGTLGARERALGRSEISITAGIYFIDDALIDLLIDQNEFAFQIEVRDSNASPNTHAYEILFPRCKLTAAPVTAGGTGQDVVVDAAIAVLQPTAIPYSPIQIFRKTI